jgi:hypothetical protein
MNDFIDNTMAAMRSGTNTLMQVLLAGIAGLIGFTASAAAESTSNPVVASTGSDLIDVITEFESLAIDVGVTILFIYVVYLVTQLVVGESRGGIKRVAIAVGAIVFLLIFRDTIVPLLEGISGTDAPDAAAVIWIEYQGLVTEGLATSLSAIPV